MKNLLVTGGAGFIGTNFVYYWLKKYPEESFESGLLKTVGWYLGNEYWWRKLCQEQL